MADEWTYRQAGVNIDEADLLVERIAPLAKQTHGPGVVQGIGGFAALYSLRRGVPGFPAMEDPMLVSGTDGVGTKLKVAFQTGRHRTVGIDLVAMCVNDVLTTGAMPLFFLDYFGTGALASDVALQVIEGIAEGCRRAECALTGGETAELPGMYASGEYDLAGFAVGIVDRPALLDGSACRPGDVLVGVQSSGLHSNGYSLARRALRVDDIDLNAADPELDASLADLLMEPTLLYTTTAHALHRAGAKAFAHITGGGLEGNVPRMVPSALRVRIDRDAWPVPAIFRCIQRRGPVPESEMWRTFNMGIGWVAAFDPAQVEPAMEALGSVGMKGWVIGGLEDGGPGFRFGSSPS
ncbi:MAG: phosphoribosylformylglycinamidine cyclo-ligase [Myxococcota bacterium]